MIKVKGRGESSKGMYKVGGVDNDPRWIQGGRSLVSFLWELDSGPILAGHNPMNPSALFHQSAMGFPLEL